jgi:hypothetical protein
VKFEITAGFSDYDAMQDNDWPTDPAFFHQKYRQTKMRNDKPFIENFSFINNDKSQKVVIAWIIIDLLQGWAIQANNRIYYYSMEYTDSPMTVTNWVRYTKGMDIFSHNVMKDKAVMKYLDGRFQTLFL